MKRTPASITAALRELDLYATADDEELELVARLGTPITVRAGRHVFDEDDTAREACAIVSGRLRIEHDGEVVASLGPGQSVGELGLLEHQRRSATVIADEDTELLVFDPRAFRQLVAEAPNIAQAMLLQVAERG